MYSRLSNLVSRDFVLMRTNHNLLNRVPEHGCQTFFRATEMLYERCSAMRGAMRDGARGNERERERERLQNGCV